ncbi:MAG: DUF4298 domain-containing protein [Bacteroidales bacterium]|nr:DUF4298 domain-containing protein [Bacteroidales bacterium]
MFCRKKRLIARVQEMEERFDRLQAAVTNREVVGEDYEVLREYMDSGRWRKDYEADEKGKLPAGMKRGVLSQDGLYDLLADAAELIGKPRQ